MILKVSSPSLLLKLHFVLLLMLSCITDKRENIEEVIEMEVQGDSTFIRDGIIAHSDEKGVWIDYTMHSNDTEKNLVHFASPAQRVVLSSTTYLNYFKAIGQLHTVVGCAWLDQVNDSEIAALLADGALRNITKGAEMDLESILDCRPEVFLFDPRESRLTDRLESMGVRCIPITEYKESDALDRVGWLQLVGMLTGKLAEANLLIKQIGEKYNSIKSSQISQSAYRPKVILSSYFSGLWSVSGPSSIMADIIEDAGGLYGLDGDGIGSVTLDTEEFMRLIPALDYIGIVSAGELHRDDVLLWMDKIERSELDRISFFYVDTDAVDYFSLGIMEPHKMLSDLQGIFNGDDLGDRHYFISLE